MMKKRDIVLFSLPFAAILAVVLFAGFLFWQIDRFETAYLADAKANVAQEAKLVSTVVTPMLKEGRIDDAVKFCDGFDRDSLRVTLIDSTGKVAADSGEKAGFLGNHVDREEVLYALKGTPHSSVRYSESLGQWMIYHAVPIRVNHEIFVLRAAVSTDRVSRILDFSRLNMLWALLFGAELVLVLAVYIVRKVRRPLIALQKSIGEITDGKLDTAIDIPESGIVRELALGVSGMTGQLRQRLAEVTAERNARELLFQTMDGAVLLFSSSGELLRFNPAAAKLFDFSPSDGVFHLSRCRIPELLVLAHETIRTGNAFEREFTFERGTGEQSLFIKGHILEENGAKHLFLTVTDLTNLRKLESFRSDFVANVSHEIKTPLTCIVGAVEALEDDPPAEQRLRLFDMLKKHSKRLNNLVQDILSLAALEKEQRKQDKPLPVIALDSVLANAVNLCRVRVENAGMTLSIRENIPLKRSGDSALLEQALFNLIENAVRYSGGTHIETALRQDGANAVLEVRDDGIGIPSEHRERVFERFYRVDKSRSRELGGTGLGLAIVKHIAQLHNGHAEVLCEPGKGALFRIVLPL